MIVIAAPYSPFDRTTNVNLGAARKIEAIVAILCDLDADVVLVNTAHNAEERAAPHCELMTIAGRQVHEITPSCHANRRLGKLLNLFEATRIAERVLERGVPRLVWLYNGYAMECLLADAFARNGAGDIVLELEDAHFARGRGVNPKPLVDWLAFRRTRSQLRHVFAVNRELCRFASTFAETSMLPGIIRDGLSDTCDRREPFATPGPTRLGYFGGLTREKGVDRVLALAASLPAGFSIQVSGGGPLERECRQAEATFGRDRFTFHGMVDDGRLHDLMASCDVLLNLHASIAAMGNGVFPFKVLEAVASGRLLISTAVPGDGIEDMLTGVVFVGHDTAQSAQAVINARATYERDRARIRLGMERVRDQFGTRAIGRRIASIVGGIRQRDPVRGLMS